MKKSVKKAFTLAEVLITLAIIGVVAALTIPTLVKSYQKQVTVTKLQKVYTILSQAVKLSEIDNGDISGWDFGSQTGTSALNFFNTYLAKYMKYSDAEVCNTSSICNAGGVAGQNAIVYLEDGTILTFWYPGTIMHVFVYLNGVNNYIGGKDVFIFFIGGTPQVINNKEVRPYDYFSTNPTTVDRSTWKDDGWGGCNKTSTNAAKPYCTGLIMYDNWQIKSDYPFFN